MKFNFKPSERRIAPALLALLPLTLTAENWTRFSPGGEYAVQCTANDRYLANTLCLGGTDYSSVRLFDDFDDIACTWVLNDEGDGNISVRNTQGGLNEGDYIRFDSKVRPAYTVNFTDYLMNQTFRFYHDADAEVTDGVLAVKVCSQGNQKGWWKSSPAGDELGYEPTHTLETATVFLLIPKTEVKVPDSSATSLTLTGDVSDKRIYEIRDNMFRLRELDLSATTLTVLPAHAFSGMTSLRKVILPQGLTEIGDAAFLSCESLSHADLPESVERIGAMAFARTALRGIAMGAAVNHIGPGAWSGCKRLAEITVSAANAAYTVIDNVLYDKSLTRLMLRPAALRGPLVLPEGLKSIDSYACEGCAALTGELILPEELTSIGAFAFANCPGLSGQLTLPASLTSLGRCAFYGDRGFGGTLSLPAGLTASGDYGAFAYLSDVEHIELSASAVSVAPSAFEGCGAVGHIKSDAAVPPIAGRFALRGIDRSSTYIEVPDADAYRSADTWEEFENYSSMPSQFARYATDGAVYIATTDDLFLSFSAGVGAPAVLNEADGASKWNLEFTDFRDAALNFTDGLTTDVAYVSAGTVYHINMEGKCYTDPADGYARNKNRSFAFWYDDETVSWAIQSNGYVWTYDGGNFAAMPYRGRRPLPEHFVWKLRGETSALTSPLAPDAAEHHGKRIVYDLTGRRLSEAAAPGIYIINGVKTLVK